MSHAKRVRDSEFEIRFFLIIRCIKLKNVGPSMAPRQCVGEGQMSVLGEKRRAQPSTLMGIRRMHPCVY